MSQKARVALQLLGCGNTCNCTALCTCTCTCPGSDFAEVVAADGVPTYAAGWRCGGRGCGGEDGDEVDDDELGRTGL